MLEPFNHGGVKLANGLFLNRLQSLAYFEKVLSLNPLVYFPMGEMSGTIAVDYGNLGEDATYNNITLAQPGIGDGKTSVLGDGSADYLDFYSATLNTDWDGDEGSLLIWYKPLNVGVWSDGTLDMLVQIRADADNRIFLQKHTANNSIMAYREAQTEAKLEIATSLSFTAFTPIFFTWSISSGILRLIVGDYYDDTASGLTKTFSGNLNNDFILIANDGKSSANWINGYLAHFALWANKVLSNGEIEFLRRLG